MACLTVLSLVTVLQALVGGVARNQCLRNALEAALAGHPTQPQLVAPSPRCATAHTLHNTFVSRYTECVIVYTPSVNRTRYILCIHPRCLAHALYSVHTFTLLGSACHTSPSSCPRLCTDNGTMVAWAGAEKFGRGLDIYAHDSQDVDFAPRWLLGDPMPPEHLRRRKGRGGGPMTGRGRAMRSPTGGQTQGVV